jgi:O-antigen ligase
MALANNLSLQAYATREHVDLGQRFLRCAVISLMSISVLAPVVRVSSDFWIKLDQLLLPGVVLVYLCLLLAGLARPIRPNWLFAVGLAFCACVSMSLVYGTQVIGHPLLFRDLFDLFKPALPVLFFTLAYEADLSEDSLRMLNWSMIPTILVICCYAYGQWFNLGFTAYLQPYYSGGLHDDGGLAHYRRVYATLSNPNYLGMLMTWVIAGFALAALIRVGSRLWILVAMVAALATLTMTGSRYGLIDTALAILLIFVLPTPTRATGKRRTAALLAIVPLVLGTIAVISVSNKATLDSFQQLRSPLRENSLRMRLDGLWRDAADQFLESPLLGHGPAKIIFSNVYTDSEYLQILKQYGLVGLVPYLCFFLVPLSMVWKGLKRVSRSGPLLERRWPATYWALCLSFVMIVSALFMNVGMGTYYNLSLVAFLWMWMGIGASAANRIARVVGPASKLLHVRSST